MKPAGEHQLLANAAWGGEAVGHTAHPGIHPENLRQHKQGGLGRPTDQGLPAAPHSPPLDPWAGTGAAVNAQSRV